MRSGGAGMWGFLVNLLWIMWGSYWPTGEARSCTWHISSVVMAMSRLHCSNIWTLVFSHFLFSAVIYLRVDSLNNQQKYRLHFCVMINYLYLYTSKKLCEKLPWLLTLKIQRKTYLYRLIFKVILGKPLFLTLVSNNDDTWASNWTIFSISTVGSWLQNCIFSLSPEKKYLENLPSYQTFIKCVF